MLERLRAFEGADQAELFGPVIEPGIFQRALAAIRRWWAL